MCSTMYKYLPQEIPWIKKWGQGFPGGSEVKNLPARQAGVQETQVPSLVWEDPTCYRATKPTHRNCWACALEPAGYNNWAHVLQLLSSRSTTTELPQLLSWHTLEPVLHKRQGTAVRSPHTLTKHSPCLPQLEKRPHRNRDADSQK